MAEWLGKPRITKDDIEKVQPGLAKYFPMLTRYFIDDQKMRVTVVFPHNKADKFKKAVTKAYGSFCATNVEKAGIEALDQWIEKHA